MFTKVWVARYAELREYSKENTYKHVLVHLAMHNAKTFRQYTPHKNSLTRFCKQ